MNKNYSKIFNGQTRAYKRFIYQYWKTEELLKAGLIGLEESRKPFENLLKKFDDFNSPKGRPKNNYESEINLKKNKDGKTFELDIDPRTASLIKKSLDFQLNAYKKLRYHHYNILAVSIWGSFETYIFMLFEELFDKKIEMLNSNETISFTEAITNKYDIKQLLIEKSLDKVGHFTLNELLPYLDKKVNYKISKRKNSFLEQFYLIRNIIAHNSGLVRKNLINKLPKEIAVLNSELNLNKNYLNKMQKQLKNVVIELEKHIIKNFYS